MTGRVASYLGLFDHPEIERVVIPLVQRDYAQGRAGPAVARIRASFLDALGRALADGEPLSLDFVYGDTTDGTFRPLDGQQRLTTLFLLHWYLAWRTGRLDPAPVWTRFDYAVRPSARRFCELLVERPPPSLESDTISAWLTDQPWFLHSWRHDPTVRSMSVVLDAIHERFGDVDAEAAWQRLADPVRPAVTFHLLPMPEVGAGDVLYVKMNSRGKPLTPFETFKARFEKQIAERVSEAASRALAEKLDGTWSDVFWAYRGDDDIIDDELMRYLHFVFEVAEWREGRVPTGDVEALAEAVFDSARADAAEQLERLEKAVDVWVGRGVRGLFEALFATAATPGRVTLFGPDHVDLFALCAQDYGVPRGKGRAFSLPLTLVLYGVLLHLVEETDDAVRRLRVLRNLVEASGNEIRRERMPALVAEVERLMRSGDLASIQAFNQAQVAEEVAKRAFLEAHPQLESALHRLEDHPLLRGDVTAFELDRATLPARAAAFARVFVSENYPRLTAALLAEGDYSRPVYPGFRFGSPTRPGPWSDLLRGHPRDEPSRTRDVLGDLLDRLPPSGEDAACLEELARQWLASRESDGFYDWRTYLVKYPEMRSGTSGLYASETDAMGYRMCMLRVTRLQGYHYDPYLLAARDHSDRSEDAFEDLRTSGYPSHPRRLRLTRSGASLRVIDEGFSLEPSIPEHRSRFDAICRDHGVADGVLRVAQRDGVDAVDRVQLAIELLRALIDAGL